MRLMFYSAARLYLLPILRPGELNGEWGFRAVSHMRGVVRKSTTWPFSKMDLPPPPYTDSVCVAVVLIRALIIISGLSDNREEQLLFVVVVL